MSTTTAVTGTGLPARCRRRTAIAATLALAIIVILSACSAGSRAPVRVSPSAPASETYGGRPSYLPADVGAPDAILTGSSARPALSTEGDSVRVQLEASSVLVSVAGPEVPGEGLPYQAEATTCTWTVTLSAATAPTPIQISAFTSIDHLGAVYHPALVPGKPAPPATLQPGDNVTFELRAVMRVGEGLMRWAPQRQQVVASWDFEVEND